MNCSNYFLICLALLACNNKPEEKHRTTKIDSTTFSVQRKEKDSIPHYTDKELEAFLDSIGKLPTQPLVDRISFYSDSVFYNQSNKSIIIFPKDFVIIKIAAKKGVMDVKTARRIFNDSSISDDCNTKDIFTTYKKGKIVVVYYPFTKNAFDEFAVSIGDPGHCLTSSLYFFKRNKIIAKHEGYSHYGLDLNHYKDIDGKTVVYYIHSFNEGSNEWWENYFFYKYDNDSLRPILNELQNGNQQVPSAFHAWWLESTVVKTNPLTIKMVYNVQLPDNSIDDFGPTYINDSTEVVYTWNNERKILEGQYSNSKINRAQVLSYYSGNNDLLFINSYYKILKNALHDTTKRKRLLNYLSWLKYQEKVMH